MTSCLLFALGGFIVGYLFGFLNEIVRLLRRLETNSTVSGFTSAQLDLTSDQKALSRPRRKIEIDEKKFVVDVSTSGMETRSEQSLGDVVKSRDDISSASNKLAQLKKLKG